MAPGTVGRRGRVPAGARAPTPAGAAPRRLTRRRPGQERRPPRRRARLLEPAGGAPRRWYARRPRVRHRRLHLAARPGGATVALLAGCGGGGGSDAEAEALLRQTFTGQKEVRSGKLDLRMALDARGLGGITGPVAVHLSGPFDNGRPGATPKFDFALDTRTGGSRLKAGAVSDGKKGYLRLEGRAYMLPDAVFKQFSAKGSGAGKAAGRAGPTLSGLGLDPSRWLRDVRTEEEATVGGDPTVTSPGKVDVERFVKDLDKLLGATGGAGSPRRSAAGALRRSAQGVRQVHRARGRRHLDGRPRQDAAPPGRRPAPKTREGQGRGRHDAPGPERRRPQPPAGDRSAR